MLLIVKTFVLLIVTTFVLLIVTTFVLLIVKTFVLLIVATFVLLIVTGSELTLFSLFGKHTCCRKTHLLRLFFEVWNNLHFPLRRPVVCSLQVLVQFAP